jgi:hypothetical protein
MGQVHFASPSSDSAALRLNRLAIWLLPTASGESSEIEYE